MRRTTPLAAALAALVLAPAAVQAAPTAIEVTSPTSGATVSRAAGPLAVTGTAAFDAVLPVGRTFFLRGTGCGATEELWLSTAKGTDDYDGCGIIGGIPNSELIDEPKVLTSRDGLPAKLDGSKPVTGTIRAESWVGEGIPGVGQVTVTGALYGESAGGDFVDLGSFSNTAVNSGADHVNVPFSVAVPADAAGVVLNTLTLEVTVSGVGYNTTNLGMSGDSKLVLPILDEGAIQVSDSSGFGATRTVTTLVGPDGTWRATLPALATGAQTVFARAVQGTARLSAAPVPVTVVP